MTVATSSVRTGCVSWTYSDWVGSFYPSEAKSSELLSLYSRVFDIVEIDSTFYHIPTAPTVRQWTEKTPEAFLFAAKLSKRITHDSRLKGVSDLLGKFEGAVRGLGPKLACVVAQLPPNFKFEKGFDQLSQFLGETDPGIRYTVEFRDVSWFRRETYDLLRRENASLAWSVNDSTGGKINPEITSDLLYVRLMGKFGEFSRFDRIQKEKVDALTRSVDALEGALDKVSRAYLVASNHFEGFAPATVNSCRELLGLPRAEWGQKMGERRAS